MFPVQMPVGKQPPNRVTFALQVIHMLCDPSHYWGTPGEGAGTEEWQAPKRSGVNGKSIEGLDSLRNAASEVLEDYIRGKIPDEEAGGFNGDAVDNVFDRLEAIEEELGIDPPAVGETDVDVELDEAGQRAFDAAYSDDHEEDLDVDAALGKINLDDEARPEGRMGDI